MNEQTKESKFLDAINRYAESQKARITQEIEDYKNTKIEQATEQGLQDAYDLIHAQVTRRKSAIVNETAKRELELKRELFTERQQIEDEVFEAAKDRLKNFVNSADYAAFLQRSAKKAKELFGDQACVVSLAPFDKDKESVIAAILPQATFEADNRIQLGGARIYCPEKGICADDTLDSRLNDQRQWFIENAGLEVV